MEFCCENDSIVVGRSTSSIPVYDATCVAEIELGGIYGLQNSLYCDIDSLLWFMEKSFIIIR